MDCPYRAFYKRDLNSIDGVFTILNRHTGEKIFSRLPARSGQRGYTQYDWTRGKAPIPRGQHYIHFQTPKQKDRWPGRTGIGEFWSISNQLDNPRLIRDKKTGLYRYDIGIHPENSFPGSAGCIVLVIDTKAQREQVIRLSNWAESQIGKYFYMPLEVFT